MKTRQPTIAAVIATAILAAGCASTPLPPDNARNYPAASQRDYSSYGMVESIDTVNAQSGAGSIGIGTVGGAVVGGLLGNQVGGGTGRKAATVAGAVGGALAGNQVDKHRNTAPPMYDIRVRLNDGSYQTVRQESLGDIRVGNRVRIENGRAMRY